MDESDELLQWCRNIEKTLKTDFDAKGRGLSQLTTSIHGNIPYTLESEILFFAKRRNKWIHNGDALDYNKTKEKYERIIHDLKYCCVKHIEFNLFNRKDLRCLDSTRETHNGARVLVWDCHGAAFQKWILKKINGNSYNIVSVNSGKYLDVSGFSMDNSAVVHQWDSNNSDNQIWELIANEEGSWFIKAKHSGKYLSVIDGKDGADVVQYDLRGLPNQRWDIKMSNF